jgi:BolA protein
MRSVKDKKTYCLTLPDDGRSSWLMTVAQAIHGKLTNAFAPSTLEVSDESTRHAGHAGAQRPDGRLGETHFSVRLVSSAFEGLSRVERQRRVYAALDTEFKEGLHALSLTALTPAEARR